MWLAAIYTNGFSLGWDSLQPEAPPERRRVASNEPLGLEVHNVHPIARNFLFWSLVPCNLPSAQMGTCGLCEMGLCGGIESTK